MNKARNHPSNAESTPYYHVIARCVRRACLCGIDADSGRDFEHRRQWVIDRLEQLFKVFAIELCSISVFHDQYDLIIRLAPKQAEKWTGDEVLDRWERLYDHSRSSMLSLVPDTAQSGSELTAEMVEVKRQCLTDLGWFTKSLNEYIAHKAGLEDCFKGDFWETRNQVTVHSRPFLSEPC